MKPIAKKMLAMVLVCLPVASYAQVNMLMTQSIPALDEIGLISLVALVGVVAGWAIKRRGK